MFDPRCKFAKEHNLRFNTHTDPKKSKRNIIAYMKSRKKPEEHHVRQKSTTIGEMVSHLGCKLSYESDRQKEKCAIHINNVNEICQQYHYANPYANIRVNNISNSQFYGLSL